MNMKRISILSLVLSSFLMVACSGNNEESGAKDAAAPSVEEATASSCTYTRGEGMPEVLWIAYKYTEKVGVKGQFEEVTVSNTGSGENIAAVLKGATIDINTTSSNSGDPTRDPKIKETFFGGLSNGEQIQGVITGVSGDEQSGSIEANITMNGEEKPASGSYEMQGDQLELKFDLNVETWSAMDALNALNEVCEDLHKGADGKSILWPDVTVYVTTSLIKNCE